MTVIAAIRTHKWDDVTEALAARLKPVFGDNLVVAFHNRPAGVTPPIPVVDINDGFLQAHGLQVVSDWGWRCGDYFLYALRAAYPQASHYWLIEPDVYFTGDIGDFFARMAGRDEDILAPLIETMRSDHRFSKGLPELPHYRALFAFVRFSNRALERLQSARVEYAKRAFNRFYSNDELFCFSTAMADPGLSKASISEITPDWMRARDMATDPDLLVDLVADRTDRGIFHPVRPKDGFIRALAQRATSNMGFLAAMRASLMRLDEADDAEIARLVAENTLAALREVRNGKE